VQRPCPVRLIRATAYCHSTEDCGKVAKALRNVVPGEVRMDRIAGYYGNAITALYAEAEGCRASEIFANIIKLIDDLDFEILLNELTIYKNRLFIRLNKQKALRGVLRLDSGDDVIHVEIRIPQASADSLIEELRKLRGSRRNRQE
jgi:RNA binding exosome subunit